MIRIVICAILLFLPPGFHFDNEYIETDEIFKEIICSSDSECPETLPRCRENHCQPNCTTIADCNGLFCYFGR
jgi:hypothetical protein